MAKTNFLHLSIAEQEEELFNRMLDVIAGAVAKPDSLPRVSPALKLEIQRLRSDIDLIEQRISALEAELVSRIRKCPCCCQLTLNVIAASMHPEFGDQAVELHELACKRCNYRGHRLYDPAGCIC